MNKQFIKASAERCTFDRHVPAPYLRKRFVLDFVPERAELSICGLGFYVLYINGVNVTKGMLAPYVSNVDHYCYFDTYDLREHLRMGENVIGICLTSALPLCPRRSCPTARNAARTITIFSVTSIAGLPALLQV